MNNNNDTNNNNDNFAEEFEKKLRIVIEELKANGWKWPCRQCGRMCDSKPQTIFSRERGKFIDIIEYSCNHSMEQGEQHIYRFKLENHPLLRAEHRKYIENKKKEKTKLATSSA